MVALAVVPVPARHRRLPAAAPPERFPRGAAQIYATFDLGLIGYWAVPTAPPWYAARQGLMADGRTPELRRMMVEYGEHFWKSGWAPLYGFLGGNPLAAMPSLHFATSVTAAHVLADSGPPPGRWPGRTRPRSAWRSSTWASTTWSTCRRASRSRRPSARGTPQRPRPLQGAQPRRAGARGEGARMNDVQRRATAGAGRARRPPDGPGPRAHRGRGARTRTTASS